MALQLILFSLIPQMPYCHHRVKKQHPGAGEAHNLAHTLTHIGLVAMNGAFAARTLSLAELAMLQTAVGILEEPAAFIAQSAVTLFISAIYGYHCRNGLFLSLYP